MDWATFWAIFFIPHLVTLGTLAEDEWKKETDFFSLEKKSQRLEVQIPFGTRVARFFWSKHTKLGNLPNDHKLYQTAIKHSKWS
jgi:hypothetical protein